jgi:hypothetical protein
VRRISRLRIVAQQYLCAGDLDRGVESLEKAYKVRDPNVLDVDLLAPIAAV